MARHAYQISAPIVVSQKLPCDNNHMGGHVVATKLGADDGSRVVTVFITDTLPVEDLATATQVGVCPVGSNHWGTSEGGENPRCVAVGGDR